MARSAYAWILVALAATFAAGACNDLSGANIIVLRDAGEDAGDEDAGGGGGGDSAAANQGGSGGGGGAG